MKKRYAYLLAGFFILITIFFISSLGVDKTKSYHNSQSILIGIDGNNQTLETITPGSFIFSAHNYTSIGSIDPGHNASQIWVSVQDGETTLINALTSSSFPNRLCPPKINVTNASDYTNKNIPNPGHLAIEIQLANGKNLQESINAGDLCDYSWYTNSSSCSVTCGGGILTSYCRSKLGAKVADNYCYGTKPSVSCNTQGCIWQLQPGRGCIPTDRPDCGGSCCPYNPGSKACSPAGTSCISFGGQCTAGLSTSIYRYICS
jgi:hypothetical protein